MKKGLNRPTRRLPRLEVLEDRTLLSGNVLATLNPTTGVLTIQGDIGNNHIHIFSNLTSIPGVPLLRVQGDLVTTFTLPPTPPDFTSVNAVSFTDFTLSSVTSINIAMLGGNCSVKIGTDITGAVHGFDIPKDITITAAGGNDTFNVENVGNTGIGAPPGHLLNKVAISNTGGNNSVLINNVVAGEVDSTTAGGKDSVTITGHVDIGTVKVVTGDNDDSVTVNAAPVLSLRPQAFGLLSIVSGNGNDTENVNGTTAGVITMVAGNGRDNGNSLTLSNSTFISGSIISGSVPKNNTVVANGNTITGSAGLSITTGNAGNKIAVTVDNDHFSGGNLNVKTGDGVVYWDLSKDAPYPDITGNESTFESVGSTGIGSAAINLGKFFQSVSMADSMKSLTLAVGDNWMFTTLNNTVSGNESITMGSQVATGAPYFTFVDNDVVHGNQSVTIGSAQPSGVKAKAGPTAPSISINNPGSLDDTFTFGDNLTVNLGTVLTPFVSTSLTLNLGNGDTITAFVNVNAGNNGADPTKHSGDIVVQPNPAQLGSGNNDNVTLNGAGATPHAHSVTITLNDGATVLVQNLTAATDITTTVGNNANSLGFVNTVSNNLTITAGNGISSTGSSYILVQGALVNNNLTINTSNTGTLADGNYTMALINDFVLDALFAQLGGGINTVFAQMVTSLFGNIDGGSGGSSTYFDLGGNSGYTTSGFSGYY
jgi:hypothetical protein